MTFYQVAFLFFTYSFLGWVGEVVFTAAVRRKYQDRGVLSGPLCILYGIGALVITFAPSLPSKVMHPLPGCAVTLAGTAT